ncbi:myelin protein zero-like protein 1 isoform X2 [Cebus imitator]|uniref:myelin protein zero-like protein 1 isoform X2 n=1 Tax=Cebus imitator TaxID=2715852 RepID=UPI00080A1238|nr:myelin protein zero-like protein 1 isoform X2 [Cebus imitator]
MAAPVGAWAVIAAPDRRRWPWSVLTAALGLLIAGVSGLEVYTPKELFVANGTQGKLTCKFKSTDTTGRLTSVSWSFQPEGADTAVSFFHYSQGNAYPGNYPPFKDRTNWAGDLDKKDASIYIENMQFIHNGTYICDVKNPPDIVAQPGHIRLYVIEKGTSVGILAVIMESPLSHVRLEDKSVISREFACVSSLGSGGHSYCCGRRSHSAHQHDSGCPL